MAGGPLMFDKLVSLAEDAFDRFRRRIEGLTDDEYRWEPVDGCWSIREVDGQMRIDGDFIPEGHPAPVTTIAWRMGHIGGPCLLGFAHREWPDVVAPMTGHPIPRTADEMIAFCELGQRSWLDNFKALGPDGITRESVAVRGTPYEGSDVADVHLHVYDEVIHHAAEVALLRDLYRAGLG